MYPMAITIKQLIITISPSAAHATETEISAQEVVQPENDNISVSVVVNIYSELSIAVISSGLDVCLLRILGLNSVLNLSSVGWNPTKSRVISRV